MHLSFLVALPSLSVIVDTTRDGIWRIVGREPVHFLRCSYCATSNDPLNASQILRPQSLKKLNSLLYLYIYICGIDDSHNPSKGFA